MYRFLLGALDQRWTNNSIFKLLRPNNGIRIRQIFEKLIVPMVLKPEFICIRIWMIFQSQIWVVFVFEYKNHGISFVFVFNHCENKNTIKFVFVFLKPNNLRIRSPKHFPLASASDITDTFGVSVLPRHQGQVTNKDMTHSFDGLECNELSAFPIISRNWTSLSQIWMLID